MKKIFLKCSMLIFIISGILFCGCSSETDAMLREKLNEEISASGTLEYYANLEDDERELLCEEKHIELEGVLTKKYTSSIWYIGEKKDDFHIECWFEEEPEGVEVGDYLVIDGVCQYVFGDYLSVKKCSIMQIIRDGEIVAECEVEPTSEPTKEPILQPTEEPTPEPTKEPTPQPTEEPTLEPIKEPTPQPAENPTAEPTKEPTPQPAVEPASQPVGESVPEQTNQVVSEPVVKETPAEPSNAGTGTYAVNGKNGKIHIVGQCSATKPGSKSEMDYPIYFNSYEEAEAKSISIDPGLEKKKCGNCWKG